MNCETHYLTIFLYPYIEILFVATREGIMHFQEKIGGNIALVHRPVSVWQLQCQKVSD